MKKTIGVLTLAAALAFPTMAQAAENPPTQDINRMLTDAAIAKNIPPEVLKAVAMQESSWRQFENGQPYINTKDNGIGLMQLTNKMEYDEARLKTDIVYNIEKGAEVLDSMYRRGDVPKVTKDRADVEDWYFAVLAYNGMVQANSPIIKATGEVNDNSYAQKVFKKVYEQQFLMTNAVQKLKVLPEDVAYATDSSKLTFLKNPFTPIARVERTNYQLKSGQRVLLRDNNVKLRAAAKGADSNVVATLSQYEPLTITGAYQFDANSSSANAFVWYPVKTATGKKGYVSSAYLQHTHPIIQTKNVEMYVNESLASYVKAIDAEDGDVSKKVRASFNSAKAGKYEQVEVTVTDKDGYETKQSINVTVKKVTSPTKPTVTLKALGAKKVKVSYKVSGATKYELQYATKSSMKQAKTVKTSNKTKTLTGLTKGKRYYVRVRAYKTVGGKTYESYSAVKSIVVK